MKRPNRQSGNALFLILIAVALFAALSYAVTQSGRGGGSTDKEQALILAGQITQQAAGIQSAYNRMRLLGVGTVSFAYSPHPDQAAWDGNYGVYNTAPENELFNPLGGGTTFVFPPGSACTDGICETVLADGWFFFFPALGISVEDIGTASADLFMTVSSLKLTVCEAINKGFGFAPAPVADDNGDPVIEAYPGAWSACFSEGGVYIFYNMLEPS